MSMVVPQLELRKQSWKLIFHASTSRSSVPGSTQGFAVEAKVTDVQGRSPIALK